jgi:ribosomal protein L24
MRSRILSSLVLIAVGGFLAAASAQTKLSLATGEVLSIDSGKIMLKTDGGQLTVVLSEKTEYKRVSPENPSLKSAVGASFVDIGSGDKLVVTGIYSDDRSSLQANAVYLMSKADIAQKHAKESEQWRARGVSGRVTAVNRETDQISVEVRGLTGSTTVVLTPKADARFKRYAPNSVKYSEALASSIADIQPGDMLRALGDRSADGTSFAAEEILTGAFRTLAGTVKSVDAEKNEIVITDIQANKDVTISLASATTLKRFPEQMAQMMAARQNGGGAAGPAGPPRPNPEAAAQPGTGGGQPRGPGGPRGNGGIDDMLDRFPNITAADLKPGDMIAVSSSRGANLDRIMAIKLLAGVEPFIRAAQAAATQQRGGQSAPSLNIPGLDGVDFQ